MSPEPGTSLMSISSRPLSAYRSQVAGTSTTHSSAPLPSMAGTGTVPFAQAKHKPPANGFAAVSSGGRTGPKKMLFSRPLTLPSTDMARGPVMTGIAAGAPVTAQPSNGIGRSGGGPAGGSAAGAGGAAHVHVGQT